MKKLIGYVLLFSILFSIVYFFNGVQVFATDGIDSKINALLEKYGTGSYFSVNGLACNHEQEDTCCNCRLSNISSEASNICGDAYTCVAFAKYAHWFIFGTSYNSSYKTATIDNINSIAQKGDYIKFYNSNGSVVHAAIYLDSASDGFYAYTSNYKKANDVKYNRHYTKTEQNGKYSNYTFRVHHASNYNAVKNANSSTVSDYYLLTAPDGVQTMRESYSTSSTAILDIPAGNIVCVTKYSPNGEWGYVTYNGKSGWIKLYYVEEVDSPTESTVKDYYKLTAPDGVQTMRESYSTSAAAILDIPAENIVCVTKYSPNREWGYVTYSGKSGWIKLYYVEPHTVHTYGAWVITQAATCTTSGSKKRVCACGVQEISSITALGHNYSKEWTIDQTATCTVSGSKSHHCTRCSAKTDVTIVAAKGHSYGTWTITKNANCTENGSKVRACTSCKHSETQTIAALGHNYSKEWTIDQTATCTVSGSKSHHCTRCDVKKDMTTIAAHGHSWSDWITTKEPTEKETGLKTKSCSNCSQKETAVLATLTVDGHEHSFGNWVIVHEATCVNGGTHERQCSICNQKESMTSSPLGHKFGEWKVQQEPTYEKEGVIERICTQCEFSETDVISRLVQTFAPEETSTPSIPEQSTPTATGQKIEVQDDFDVTEIIYISTIVFMGVAVAVLTVLLIKRKK